MTQIFDLSDPAKPVFIRDFGLPGQEPGATRSAATGLHGAISTGPKGNRVYFGYGTGAQRRRNRRPRKAAERAERTDQPEPALSAHRQRRSAPEWGRTTVSPVLRVELPEFGRHRNSAM